MSGAAALLAAALGLAAPPARADDAWTIDGRCVARVCVGDSVHLLRAALPGAQVRPRPDGTLDVSLAGQPALHVELEEGPPEPADARRIAVIEVLRAGTRSGVGDAAIGGRADALERSAPGRWLAPDPKAGLRWWQTQRPSPPGTHAYPVSFAVDGSGRIVRAAINGGNEREAAYADLATALAASQTRVAAIAPALASLPRQAPALAARGEVYADLAIVAADAALRIATRADCDAAACEILTVDVGADARDDSATEPLQLADGTPARFRPTQCGGSCTPATLVFERGGQPVRIVFDTGRAAPRIAGLDAARDRQLLLQIANSVPPARRP